jgi:hypothetical protein|tara:strand:+ start:2988 stop:3236 length:249 start_codon:yes stop_codon:yes gene_type:complete
VAIKVGTLVYVYPLLGDLTYGKVGLIVGILEASPTDISKLHEVAYGFELDYANEVYRVQIGKETYLYSDVEVIEIENKQADP